MTARKTAKKKTGKTGKTATKKAGAKKPTASAKTGRKTAKAGSGSKAGKKAATPRTRAAAKPAPAAKKKAAKAAPENDGAKVEKTRAPAAAPAEAAPTGPRAATSALNVNMGHVFALKPRVNTSFRSGDLAEARQRLKNESYASLADAARAVAEKALELTHESGSRRGFKKKR